MASGRAPASMGRSTRCEFLATSGALAIPLLHHPAEISAGQRTTPPDLTLWYDKPAAQWVDALPIRNERLGAMFFGAGDDGSPATAIAI